MPSKYGILITPETIDIVTFLNDGVRPDATGKHFLLVQVDGPREITTKVTTLEEYNAELRDADIHELF
jgi:hypothetical protein